MNIPRIITVIIATVTESSLWFTTLIPKIQVYPCINTGILLNSRPQISRINASKNIAKDNVTTAAPEPFFLSG
jgi:hypothetical protein